MTENMTRRLEERLASIHRRNRWRKKGNMNRRLDERLASIHRRGMQWRRRMKIYVNDMSHEKNEYLSNEEVEKHRIHNLLNRRNRNNRKAAWV